MANFVYSDMAEDEQPNALGILLRHWLTLLLLAAMVMVSSWAIHQSGWANGTEAIFSTALIGLVFGFISSQSRWSTRKGWAIGAVVGISYCFLLVSESLPPVDHIIQDALALLLNTLTWILGALGGLLSGTGAPQPIPPVDAISTFVTNATDFGSRLSDWIRAGLRGSYSEDNGVFVFWITLVGWAIGFVATWGFFRHNDVLIAAIVPGVAMVINLAYSGQGRWPFVLFLAATLLLMVRLNLHALHKRWESRKLDYATEVGLDVLIASVILTTALTFVATMAPRVGSNPISETFWTVFGGEWAEVDNTAKRLFSGVQSPSGVGLILGSDNRLFSGPRRFSQPYRMYVTTDERNFNGYWRGATFDAYTGYTWYNTSGTLLDRRADEEPIPPPPVSYRRPATFSFRIVDSPSDIVFAPDFPTKINIPYRVQVASSDAPGDYDLLRARRVAVPDLEYTIESLVTTATEDQMLNAQGDVPDDIRRYLQSPNLPQRVVDLTRTVVRGKESQYEKALAIELFLRRIPYSIAIPPPPADKDAVDYFLFEAKQGYADYYASTMVVMLRTVGIPARLAIGFATGRYDVAQRRFVVTEKQAHTWPEVYFPGLGWIPFEPSPNQTPIDRGILAAEISGSSNPELDEFYDELGEEEFLVTGAATVVGGSLPGASILGVEVPDLPDLRPLLGILVAVVVGWFGYNFVQERRMNPHQMVRHVYRKLVRAGRLAGIPVSTALTPQEFGYSLLNNVHSSASKRFPDGAVQEICATYAESLYSSEGISKQQKNAVTKAWGQLRWRLLRKGLLLSAKQLVPYLKRRSAARSMGTALH
jgi:transglutaminase-like putative cysteine protease